MTMIIKQLKPETIVRRRREREAELARQRGLFLATYEANQAKLGLPQLPPATGSRYSSFLPDGRGVIISADKVTVFGVVD